MAVPNLWRTKKQRYRLQAEVCPTCAQTVFPPREVCPRCHQPMANDLADERTFILPALLLLSQTPVAAAGDD